MNQIFSLYPRNRKSVQRTEWFEIRKYISKFPVHFLNNWFHIICSCPSIKLRYWRYSSEIMLIYFVYVCIWGCTDVPKMYQSCSVTIYIVLFPTDDYKIQSHQQIRISEGLPSYNVKLNKSIFGWDLLIIANDYKLQHNILVHSFRKSQKYKIFQWQVFNKKNKMIF